MAVNYDNHCMTCDSCGITLHIRKYFYTKMWMGTFVAHALNSKILREETGWKLSKIVGMRQHHFCSQICRDEWFRLYNIHQSFARKAMRESYNATKCNKIEKGGA